MTVDERIAGALERIAKALEAQRDPEASLTTEEAAAFLRVSPSTLRRMKEAGLPFHPMKEHGDTYTRRDLMEFRAQYKTTKKRELKLVHAGGRR